ncbi:Epoxyqueuosine reductase [Usitatibacter rugosus]|uniref:Epoxyqueuosine reductase n=1 Tax=Usitatibacter rugosus TaxID=2732067 RepID=A0A6M4H0I7_9PROT|nr:tRNA epoxyqueuosine(34) reductase QueG [Usitatibacter rugosus]QJR12184.1 Epoxyqueuosine reductase [Usitatibacter rugosus]
METQVATRIEDRIKQWGRELGFDAVAIAGTNLEAEEARLLDWLGRGWHGGMDYMARHGARRARPAELVPGTLSVISVRLNYTPPAARDSADVLDDPESAFISRYALGRDYHKVIRNKLQAFADRLVHELGSFHYRVFTDSAPVMEVALAARAGLGWRGKHTLLLSREAGSLYFLGELFVSLDLERDAPVGDHCGTCTRCIEACPTNAIVAPYQLDARRCISYLTIEHAGAIPEEFRPAMGNRIYGCDDCQLACPWNKYAELAASPDFAVRHGLDDERLVNLFAWTQDQFDTRFEGSAIRRIGHERWLRNIAVALGNASPSRGILAALRSRRDDPSALVREHVAWALARHEQPSNGAH